MAREEQTAHNRIHWHQPAARHVIRRLRRKGNLALPLSHIHLRSLPNRRHHDVQILEPTQLQRYGP